MFDLIIKFEPYELEIEGQKITMELKPLLREHMILLASMFEDIAETKEDAKSNQKKKLIKQYSKNLEYQKFADPIFKDHVKNVQGLCINGAEPTYKDFADIPALCNITIAILTELVIRSSIKFNDIKN